MPVEGALPGAPNPGDIAKKNVVERERKHNMYFSAVGFINDVKTGPFWEHSPILFDISGVRSGWGKINKVSLQTIAIERVLIVLGHDQDVQCRSPVEIPSGSALPFWFSIQLGTRSQCPASLCFGAYRKPANKSSAFN